MTRCGGTESPRLALRQVTQPRRCLAKWQCLSPPHTATVEFTAAIPDQMKGSHPCCFTVPIYLRVSDSECAGATCFPAVETDFTCSLLVSSDIASQWSQPLLQPLCCYRQPCGGQDFLTGVTGLSHNFHKRQISLKTLTVDKQPRAEGRALVCSQQI